MILVRGMNWRKGAKLNSSAWQDNIDEVFNPCGLLISGDFDRFAGFRRRDDGIHNEGCLHTVFRGRKRTKTLPICGGIGVFGNRLEKEVVIGQGAEFVKFEITALSFSVARRIGNHVPAHRDPPTL